MLPRTRGHLDGPPFALPPLLDAAAERWWRCRPRTRVALALGALTVVLVAGVSHAAASPHGPPTVVWIAEHDLPVGTPLASGNLRRASWPERLVPDGALTEPAGSLVAPLPRGAVATAGHVGDGGMAAGLPHGSAAVALPPEAFAELPVGTRVDLVTADLDGRGVALATDAVVLGSDGTATWVAVDRNQAAAVTGAALHGAVGVILLPP